MRLGFMLSDFQARSTGSTRTISRSSYAISLTGLVESRILNKTYCATSSSRRYASSVGVSRSPRPSLGISFE